MEEVRLTIPSYNQAMVDLMQSVVRGFAALDPLIGQIPVRVTSHAGPTRNVPGPQPLDHPLTASEVQVEIHFDVIRQSDVDAFTAILLDFAGKYHER